MKIYVDNISVDNIVIDNIKFTNQKQKTYIYSDEGIYYFKKNKLNKIKIIDLNIEKKTIDNFDLLIDKSVIKKYTNNYQIPLPNKIENIKVSYYKINNDIKFIICKDEKNKIVDFYFKSKKQIDNYKDIISFLLLLK
jgi:hypothetical protein